MTLAALALAVVSPLTPFPPGEVTVGGEIGRRMAAAVDCLTQRIDIEKTYLRHFRVRREKPEVWGGFTGWSMALDALVKAAAHGIGGDEMRRFKDKWLRETIATQAADGSISMYSGKPGRWDSHEQAYFLQAFARDAIWFGDADAREAGRRLGDFILANDVSVNLGLQSGLLWLFRATGDLRYADFCRDRYLIEGTNDDYDRLLPVNGVAHVYTWLERALAQCEYAAFTGRCSPSLFDSTDEAFRRAFGDCLSVSGTMSGGNHWGEVWDDTQLGRGKWGETCATAYLLRLCAGRMAAGDETRYGDLYERVLYNAFFAAQSADGRRHRYFTPFDQPGEWWERGDTYCCPNNFRRMVFEIPDAVFARRKDGIAVNLYAPARLKTAGLDVEMKTAYPLDGKVRLRVTAAAPGRLWLRVPRWTRLPDAGQWREWRYAAGTSRLEVEFPMRPRLVAGRRFQSGKAAVLCGPLVYALSSRDVRWRGGVDCLRIDGSCPLRKVDGGIEVRLKDINLRRGEQTATFVPFADETRFQTYFGLVGMPTPTLEADELLLPEERTARESGVK